MHDLNEKTVSALPPSESCHELPGTTTPTSDVDTVIHRDGIRFPEGPIVESKERPGNSPTSKHSRRQPWRKRKLWPSCRQISTRCKPSLVLENHGSVARDHLALERTFLAYIRTSLLLASTGVALVQLFTVASSSSASSVAVNRIRQFSRPLGATFVIFGFFVLVLGAWP
ncbi:hypothetical protein H0H92_010912 [Tricholoma furcatifolium]|nr:hypothetical protein H0H92_010912 [Tricholoma furcatifolium]